MRRLVEMEYDNVYVKERALKRRQMLSFENLIFGMMQNSGSQINTWTHGILDGNNLTIGTKACLNVFCFPSSRNLFYSVISGQHIYAGH